MKKICLVFVALCMWIGATAQNEYESQFMRFYVPDCTGAPFPVSVDTYIVVLENGQMCIKTHANFSYNAAEYSYFQKYAIPKGNKIYFKLDSGEIVTLTCSNDKSVPDGFITTENGTLQNYAEYSYFPIDTATVDSLKKYNIVKVRGCFKYEILDGSMQFTIGSDIPETKDSFKQAETNVRKQYIEAKSEADRQKILKENPLLDF